MSNLSKRVEKAKQIDKWMEIGIINRQGKAYSLWTFTDDGKEKNYEVTVKSNKRKVNIPFGDSNLPCFIFNVKCRKMTGGKHECPGNSHHTVCYHGFFALVESLKKANMQISFYENVFDAVNGLNFGGELVKIQSTQGSGIVWATVRKVEKKEELKDKVAEVVDSLSSQEKVNVMRLSREESEGID